jgi:hypothetical protein
MRAFQIAAVAGIFGAPALSWNTDGMGIFNLLNELHAH